MMTGNNSHSAAAGSQNRLYSYVSGSEGEEDQLHRPTGRRGRGEHAPADAVDGLSSCSSLSSVHSSSPSDVDRHQARLPGAGQHPRPSVDRLTDNVDMRGRVGENVYSRIKEPGDNDSSSAFCCLFVSNFTVKCKRKHDGHRVSPRESDDVPPLTHD